MLSPGPFRLRSIDHPDLESQPDVLAAIGAGHYGGLLVRGVFGRDELRDAVARLEAAPAYRNRLSPDSAIEFVGLPLQWCDAGLHAYLAEVGRLNEACTHVLPPGMHLLERTYRVLEQAARRPVRVFHGGGGSYMPATLRRYPPGEEVGPHFELGQLESASYAELRDHIEATTIYSFYVVLAAPERGGELAIYDLRWDDADASRVRSSERPPGPLLGRYEPHLVAAAEGDVLLFDSGRHAHRVLPVGGTRPRWTAGGLLAPAQSRHEVLAWA
jgi:hypothetical protein